MNNAKAMPRIAKSLSIEVNLTSENNYSKNFTLSHENISGFMNDPIFPLFFLYRN